MKLDETGSGKVYTTQEAYRRAVDEALFRLGDRYAALMASSGTTSSPTHR